MWKVRLMLSQYPPLAQYPDLARQYQLFAEAAGRAQDPEIRTIWVNKITNVVNRAYALSETSSLAKGTHNNGKTRP